jgi:glycosyltransferase involved in cell wall biosynthesis
MTPPEPRPVFSVIIPTRNRAALFAVALQSVLDQRFRDFEVIVVSDGSAEEHAAQYRAVLDAAPPMVRLLSLVRTERGHGQSYALNFGAAQARGDYLCFLDDDDQWADPDHLGRVAGVIAASAERIDLVLANQKAFRNGTPVERVIWIEDLQGRLQGPPDATGAYTVTLPAHCHLNTTIVSRDFYRETGGLDEGLRYECDRDFYLRAIDRARLIRFLPNIVSRHNIPDPAAGASMSTAESELSKRLYQIRVFDKAALFSTHPELRRYAIRQRGYVLAHIAAAARRAGVADSAAYYAREALMARLAQGWQRSTTPFRSRRLARTVR